MTSIGIIATSLSRNAGGLFHSVRRSAIALYKAGVNVSIYGVEDDRTSEDLAAWDPLTPQIFSRIGPKALGIGRGLSRAVRYGGHDIIHLHGLWQYPSIAAQDAKRPVMISPRGMLDSWAISHSGWKKKIAGLLFEHQNLHDAACLHALNDSELTSIRAFGLKNPVAVIPNGTDIPRSDATYPQPDWLPDDEKKTLLFLGRLHPKKGLKELLTAWHKMTLASPDLSAGWRLVIAGWDDGGHETELSSLRSALGLNDVIFPGPLHGKQKAATLASANAFILPSYSEGLPMAVLEAWAYSLPVFMTDACNLPLGFSAKAAIRLSTDPENIADTLQQHLSRDDLLEVGQAGRTLVERHYDWAPIAQQHINVYEWMLGGGQPPSCVRLYNKNHTAPAVQG